MSNDKMREHDMKDKRCECCGYMTYQREHLGCIRAAHNAINADEYSEAVGRVRTVGSYPDESAHKVDWLVKYSRLKDGDLLYTAPPAQVPDGWQLVPVEPTFEMLKAIDQHGEYYSDESLKDAYNDMLAAAIRARGNKY